MSRRQEAVTPSGHEGDVGLALVLVLPAADLLDEIDVDLLLPPQEAADLTVNRQLRRFLLQPTVALHPTQYIDLVLAGRTPHAGVKFTP